VGDIKMADNRTLEQIVKEHKDSGKSAIAIQKELRDQGYGIPWVETKKLYQKAK